MRSLIVFWFIPRRGNRSHANALPPHPETLYQLTKLPAEVLQAKLKDGSITPKLGILVIIVEQVGLNQLISMSADIALSAFWATVAVQIRTRRNMLNLSAMDPLPRSARRSACGSAPSAT